VPTFVVLAHQHPQHLARLAARLHPYPVIVHVNARVDQRPFERAVEHLETVSFLPHDKRRKTNWAGFSLVLAVQNLLREAVMRTDPDDHIVVLSGSDYPIRPVTDFANHLRDAPFRQHIRYFEVEHSDDHHRRFIQRRHYRDFVVFPNARRGSTLANCNEVVKRSLSQAMRWHRPEPCPAGLRPMRGSLWVALTGRCVDDVLRSTTPEVDRYFSRVFCPDESYLHTMVAASTHHFDTPSVGAEPYPGRLPTKMANFHLIDDTLDKFYTTIDDLAAINASDKWFVRKVAPPQSDTLLDSIDARLDHMSGRQRDVRPPW
jgi:Core-2/I-Branching enzyme